MRAKRAQSHSPQRPSAPVAGRTLRLVILAFCLALGGSAAPAAGQDRGLLDGSVTVHLYDDPGLTDFVTSRPWSGPVEFTADCDGEQDPWAGCKLDPALADGGAYGARWTAWLVTPTSGLYTFWVAADDGVRLFIDGALVADSSWNFPSPDDQPPPQTVTLDEGQHALQIEYMQRFPSVASLSVQWAGPGFSIEPIPTGVEVGEDLLVNGSFEDGLTGWSTSPSGVSTGTGGPCGDLALELGPGTANARQAVGPSGVEPGGLYVLEGFTRLTSPDAPGGIELGFLDSSGGTVARAVWPVPVSTGFEPFELIAAAPPGTAEIEVVIKGRRLAEPLDLTVDCLRLTARRLDVIDDPAFAPRDLQTAVGGDLTCTGDGDQDDRERCAVVVYQRFVAVWPLAREITLGDVLGFVFYREMHLVFAEVDDVQYDFLLEAFFRNFWEVVDGSGGGTGVTPRELIRFLGEKQGWYGLARLGNPVFGPGTVAETIGVVDVDFRAAFGAYRDGLATNRPFDWGNWALGYPGYATIGKGCIESLKGDPQGRLPGPPLVVRFCSESASPPYDYYFAVLTKAQDLEMPPTSGCNDDCVPEAGSCPDPGDPVTIVPLPIDCPAPPAP